MKLKRESEQLLIALVEDYQKQGWFGPWDAGFTGIWAAKIGGFFPKDGANATERYSEKDCYRAGSSLLELEYYQLIVLLGTEKPLKPRPVGLDGDGQWNWLSQIGVHITPESIRYAEQLNHPWYRKWWNKIPSDLKRLIITVLGVIIATLLMSLTKC